MMLKKTQLKSSKDQIKREFVYLDFSLGWVQFRLNSAVNQSNLSRVNNEFAISVQSSNAFCQFAWKSQL